MVWIDFDLIKVGEMAALATLELTLKDLYGQHVKRNKRGEWKFAELLRYMVDGDGLTEDKFPMSRRYGGTVVPVLIGTQRPSLADIWSGLRTTDEEIKAVSPIEFLRE